MALHFAHRSYDLQKFDAMTIELVPELGVELTPDEPYVDLRSRAEAACRAIDLLQEHGFEIPPETPEDKEVAAKLTTAYAADPIKTSKVANHVNTASLTPASLMHLRSYLDEYGKSVVSTAVELRNVVTNRLIEESQNPDPRIRILAESDRIRAITGMTDAWAQIRRQRGSHFHEPQAKPKAKRPGG